MRTLEAALLCGALALGLALAACGGRNVVTVHDSGPGQDGKPATDGSAVDASRDAYLRFDGIAAPDAGCYCKSPKVWLRGPCVPTMKLHTCAPRCDPKNPTACQTPSGNGRCDKWAAAPFCYSAAAVPACVPGQAMHFPHGTLRIEPTSGTAGKAVKITIEGGEPYIGALHWQLRIGGKPGPIINPAGGCKITFSFTPPTPGIYPVELAYGGKGWGLAGFYTASGGKIPPKQSQPGYACGGWSTCLSAKPYSCACVAGRCRCKGPP